MGPFMDDTFSSIPRSPCEANRGHLFWGRIFEGWIEECLGRTAFEMPKLALHKRYAMFLWRKQGNRQTSKRAHWRYAVVLAFQVVCGNSTYESQLGTSFFHSVQRASRVHQESSSTTLNWLCWAWFFAFTHFVGFTSIDFLLKNIVASS